MQPVPEIERIVTISRRFCCSARGQRASDTLRQVLSQSGRSRRERKRKKALSYPLGVAKDENEQSPEENGDDSGPDEDHDLHVGLVARASTQREKTINDTVFEPRINDGVLLQL